MGRVTIDTLLERKERILEEGLHPIHIGPLRKEDKVSELIKESEHVIEQIEKGSSRYN